MWVWFQKKATGMLVAVEWLIGALGCVGGAWLIFDGAYAIWTGDYVTPRSGEYAGRLGLWATLLESIGIVPRSRFVMAAHVMLGIVWAGSSVLLIIGYAWARALVLAAAVAVLWYLPFGTIVAVCQIGLLAAMWLAIRP